MNPPYVTVSAALRGAGSSVGAFALSQLDLTTSWGARPGSAHLTYVAETLADETIRTQGVAVGSFVRVEYAGMAFTGICHADTAVDAGSGRERVLEFVDLRVYLTWDWVFGVWNVPERVVSGGRYKRRYWHILPRDYAQGLRTFTDEAYSAAAILDSIFNAPTVDTRWLRNYHPDQQRPVLRLDAHGGKRLDALLTEISQRQGLMFTLWGDWTLAWRRKGFLMAGETVAPGAFDSNGRYIYPPNVDMAREGIALSGAPTRVTVCGDRNRYQLLNVPLEPDWAPGWIVFWDHNLFIQYVYDEFKDTDGTRFNALPDDANRMIGRAKAKAAALRMTLSEFCERVVDRGGDPSQFRDRKKLAGRWRMDMPCILYIHTVLLRAYRPPEMLTVGGESIPSRSVTLLPGVFAGVRFNPITGHITHNPDEPALGVGFAVASGYNVGSGLMEAFNPQTFRMGDWLALSTSAFSPATFQVDDGGEGFQTLLFDDAMILSDALVKKVGDHAVTDLSVVPSVPAVNAVLAFEAERFAWQSSAWDGHRDLVIREPGLCHERVVDWSLGFIAETPYVDGQTAEAKASELAQAYLARQFSVTGGGYRRYLFAGDFCTRLNGLYDRVSLHYGEDGHWEDVDFAVERESGAFEPEREYDRRRVEDALFPGQNALIHQANERDVAAAVLRHSRKKSASLARSIRKQIGPATQLVTNQLVGKPSAMSDSAFKAARLEVGTPLWAKPITTGAGTPELVAHPTECGASHKVFVGVVPCDRAPASGEVPSQREGVLLIRAKGPVAVGDTLVQSPATDYTVSQKVGGDTAPAAGRALQAVTTEDVRLIMFERSGVGGGGGVVARWA